MTPPDDPALVRVLAADGTFAPTPEAERYLPLIDALSDAELETFYRDMVVVRAFDRQATNLQRQGQLALWPPSFGQEAAQVGSVRAARRRTTSSRYREHVVATTRGVDPIDIIRVMRGLTHGGWDPTDPKNGNTRIYTLVLGRRRCTRPASAWGSSSTSAAARATPPRRGRHRLLRRRRVEPGRRARGDGLREHVPDPEVFFLQNNHWAISVPVATQSRGPLYRRGAVRHAVDLVDGNDVLASYAVSKLALDEARAGEGPRDRGDDLPHGRARRATTPRSTARPTRSSRGRGAIRSPACVRTSRRGGAASFFDEVDAEAQAYADDVRVRTNALGGIEAVDVRTSTARTTRSWWSSVAGSPITKRRSRRCRMMWSRCRSRRR
jgi:pyruvate dehydrogenase E1 component alpha subunit